MVRNLLSLDSYTHYRESLGERPERHVVKNEIVMADSRIAEELGVAEGAEVFTLGRVMLLSPGNSGYEESIYSVDLFPQLNQLVNDDSSMTKLLKERYGATMGKDRNMINVVSATTEIAELINVGVAEPVYQVDKTTFSNTGSRLYHSTMFYDARKVSFVVEN
ncbi:UTRA domain-containing protein [Lacticaseibacillus pantheris]|nr:UTRA domain-containing protein [Lacticaseibacillus pantheris]